MAGTSRGTRWRVLAYVLGGLSLWVLALLLTMLAVNRLAEPAEPGLAAILSGCDAACTQALFDAPDGEPPRLYYRDGTPVYWASETPVRVAACPIVAHEHDAERREPTDWQGEDCRAVSLPTCGSDCTPDLPAVVSRERP